MSLQSVQEIAPMLLLRGPANTTTSKRSSGKIHKVVHRVGTWHAAGLRVGSDEESFH